MLVTVENVSGKGTGRGFLALSKAVWVAGCLVCACTRHTAQPIPDIDDRRSAVSFASNDRKSYTQQSLGAENENLIAAPVAAKGTHNLKSRHYVDAIYRVCDKSRYPDPWGAGVGSSHPVHSRKQSTRKVATLKGLGASLGHSASCYSQQTQRFILIRER